MIERTLPLQFLKKAPFFGSHKGMNYRILKVETKVSDDEVKVELEACAYPGPFAFDMTADEKKIYEKFLFSEEGYDAAVDFLNKCYEDMKEN